MSHWFPHQPSSNSASSPSSEPDDLSLVAFLKQHQAPVPSAATDLEDWILQDIQTHQMNVYKRRAKRRWLAVGAAIAATSFATWTMVQPRQTQLAQDLNEIQLAQIQAFMEQSWDGVYVSDEEWVD